MPVNDVRGNAANFGAKRKHNARSLEVSFFPEDESKPQNRSADEKPDIEVAVPVAFWPGVWKFRGFASDGGHVVYCERQSRAAASGSSKAASLFGTSMVSRCERHEARI